MVMMTIGMFLKPTVHPLKGASAVAFNAMIAVAEYYFFQMIWSNMSNSCPNVFATNEPTPDPSTL